MMSAVIMAAVKLAGIIGAVAVCLAILVYAHVISVRIAGVIFLVFAASLVYLLMIWPNLRSEK
jgi:hypothetical protein